jgi:predicted nucleic acid-binding protein
MPEKYYLDTSIWIDYYENRSDNLRPLGDWAHRLLSLIEAKGNRIVASDLLIEELQVRFSEEEAKNILVSYRNIIINVEFTSSQLAEAGRIARERDVPTADALHAILARDNGAVLIARDHHFEKLFDITRPYKPEELI